MRQERIIQASIFDVFAEHEIGRELKAISQWLDEHRSLLGLVIGDLRRHGAQETGRHGLPGEAVLRCALLKQYRQLSYEELAFHLEDSASFRAFARLPLGWSPKKSVLHKTISVISAASWEAINQAVVMSALSLTASFGVVTLIFQDGYLSGPLGFTSTGYLDATQPILMLAIIFGLSMDYEVFLISRIREEWDRTGDNTTSVANGLQRSGRIITSAALLLAVVIGGFATSGIVIMKMIGIGMLVAVLIDATIVRALLVPATMRLLGTLNWWAPVPLLRWWERHRVVESDGSGGS